MSGNLNVNENEILSLIKFAINKKGKEKLFGYFDNAALVNLRKFYNNQELKFADYKLFFENFIKFLQKEFLDKKPVKQSRLEETFKDLAANSRDITFKLEGLAEEEIEKKNENAVFLKILKILTHSSFEELTLSRVLQIFTTLQLFFNQKIDFSLVDEATYLNAIYYSLTQAEPIEAAYMLAKLAQVGLLNEVNLASLKANFKLDITLLAQMIDKLSLNKGTNSLLTQTNLDKLFEILKNSQLNLECIAKFIQVDDDSKLLTQEKLDLAFILKPLLTQENIEKIENIALDPSKLADIFRSFSASNIFTQENFDAIIQLSKTDFDTIYRAVSLLFHEDPYENLLTQQTVDKILGSTAFVTEKLDNVLSCLDDASILNQANFKTIIGLNKAEFEKNIVPVLSIMHEKEILNQDNFNEFFLAYYKACIYDEEGQRVKISEQELADFLSKNFNIQFYDIKNNSNFNNQSTSMAERLCAALVDLLSRVGNFFQEFFNDTLKFFKEEIKNGEKKNEKKDEAEIASYSSSSDPASDSRLKKDAPVISNRSTNTPSSQFKSVPPKNATYVTVVHDERDKPSLRR